MYRLRKNLKPVGKAKARIGRIDAFHHLALGLPELRNLVTEYKDTFEGVCKSEDSWAGGSLEDAADYVCSGSTKDMEAVTKKADKILAEINMDSYVKKLVASPVGHGPIVPAFLAGHPCSMKQYKSELEESCRGAISIYVDTTCSGVITAKDMRLRGTAVCSLVLALQKIRPVELYLCSLTNQAGVGGIEKDTFTLVTVKVGIAPLNQSSLLGLFGEPSVTRHIMYSLTMSTAVGGDLKKNGILYPQGSGTIPRTGVPTFIPTNPQDIFLGALGMSDCELRKLKRDPVEWAKQHMEDSLRGEGSAYQVFKGLKQEEEEMY